MVGYKVKPRNTKGIPNSEFREHSNSPMKPDMVEFKASLRYIPRPYVKKFLIA